MSIWALVAAYLAIFVLLQVVVYRYLQRNDDGTAATWGQLPNAEVGPRRDRSVDPEQSLDSERSASPERSDDPSPDLDRESPDVDRFDDPHANVDGGTRLCPNCGARNASERVYVFCRQCAGPLGR